MSSRDGIERIKLKNGEVRYRVRLLGFHPETKKKLVDTVRTIKAEGRPDAARIRLELIDEEVAKKLGQKFGRLTFRQAAEQWHATIKRHGTSVSWGSYARKLSAAFGDRWIDTIQRNELQRYITGLTFARSTVKGLKAVIIKIFTWAKEQGHPLAKPHPTEGLVMPTKADDPDAVLAKLEGSEPDKLGLTHAELARFMPAFREQHPEMYALVLTQLAIGSRFAEVSALKRTDVDMTTGELVVRRGQVYGRIGPPKKDKARPGALPRTALEYLRGHLIAMDALKWPGFETWLFPAPPKRVRKHGPLFWRGTVGAAIKETMATVGVETRTATHFARHTLNGLIRGHVADSVLFSVVGHADQKTNAVYGDARVLDFAAEVERVILKRAGGTSGGNQASGEG